MSVRPTPRYLLIFWNLKGSEHRAPREASLLAEADREAEWWCGHEGRVVTRNDRLLGTVEFRSWRDRSWRPWDMDRETLSEVVERGLTGEPHPKR